MRLCFEKLRPSSAKASFFVLLATKGEQFTSKTELAKAAGFQKEFAGILGARHWLSFHGLSEAERARLLLQVIVAEGAVSEGALNGWLQEIANNAKLEPEVRAMARNLLGIQQGKRLSEPGRIVMQPSEKLPEGRWIRYRRKSG